MKLLKNEEVLIRKLEKSGLTGEMQRFSMNKALHHVVLKRRRVTRSVRWEEYIVSQRRTKDKWVNRLKEKGIIEVDYTDKWNPKVKFTELGKEEAEKLRK